MQIRPATTGDGKQLSLLFAQVDALHLKARPDVFQAVAGPARTKEWLDSRIKCEEFGLLVADDRGDLLGLVEVVDRAAPSAPLFKPRRYAVVETVVVKETARGRGVGRALMEAAHGWATDRGLNEIQLHVWGFNAKAQSFFEALGYSTFARKLGRRLD